MASEDDFLKQYPTGYFDGMRDVLEAVKRRATRGNPDDVLAVIDDYCLKSSKCRMSVGDAKGAILDQIFSECNPTTAVELGAFLGYSAVRMGRLLKKHGAKLYSIDAHPESVAIAIEMLEFAGLSDKVTVISGTANEVIATLEEKFGIKKVDLVFIDHMKTLYLADLMKLINVGLIQKGSVAVADNVLYPGVPEYTEFVRNHPKIVSTFFKSELQYQPHIPDGIEKSVFVG